MNFSGSNFLVLRHFEVLQTFLPTAGPWHGIPPLGGGLLHNLVRVCVPPPHEREQRPNELQALQPPLIELKLIMTGYHKRVFKN